MADCYYNITLAKPSNISILFASPFILETQFDVLYAELLT